MSDVKEIKPLEELPHFWLEIGAPLFIGNIQDICDHVEGNGFSVYYVLANINTTFEQNNILKTVRENTVFKVMCNTVGRAIQECDPKDLDLVTIKPNAWFHLPRIPYELWQKIHKFFRAVNEKLHTESIILLTYDSTIGGPEGWGYLIPDQVNGPTHCDYDQESIIGELPEDGSVKIVGSIHSHPGMSAFASVTDEADQASFDGVHFTFGWQEKNNNRLEIYAETVFDQVGYKYDPWTLLEEPPNPDVDADDLILTISSKVKCKSYNLNLGSQWVNGRWNNKPWENNWSLSQNDKKRSHVSSKIKNLPQNAPDIQTTTFIGLISQGAKKCPFCDSKLDNHEIATRRCATCVQYLAFNGERIKDIIKARKKFKIYSHELMFDKKPSKQIVVWDSSLKDDSAFTVMYVPELMHLKANAKV